MSIRVMTFVWDHYPCGGSELLLLLALADWGRDDGTNIFPTVGMMAKKTRQTVRGVQKQLTRLKEAGWLVAEEVGGGRGFSTRYSIQLDAAAQQKVETVNVVHPSVKGEREGQERVNGEVKKGERGDPHLISVKEPLIEPLSGGAPIKKKINTFLPLLPEWIPRGAWIAYCEMRALLKPAKPLATENAALLAIDKLDQLRAMGFDPKRVLDQSTMSSWQGLFELKNSPARKPDNKATAKAWVEQNERALDEATGA